MVKYSNKGGEVKKQPMSIVVCGVLGLLYFLSCSNAGSGSYDFRNTRWGVNEEQVKQVEDAKFLDESALSSTINSIMYSGNYIGMKCFIIYYFENGKLREGKVQVVPDDTTSSMEIYKRIKAHLIDEYGQWGESGSEEEIRDCHTVWEISRSRIELSILEHGSASIVRIDWLAK